MDLKNYLANGLHIQIKLGQTSALHISILEEKKHPSHVSIDWQYCSFSVAARVRAH